MAVAFVNNGTAVGTTGTTGAETVTPAAPASIVVGNMLVVVAAVDASNATMTSSQITTATGGWVAATDTGEYTAATPRMFTKLFWKAAASTSETMPGIALAGMATGVSGGCGVTMCLQFSGVNTTAPFGTSGANYAEALATTTTVGAVPSAGTVATGDMALAAASRSDDNANTAGTISVSAGWTNLTNGTTMATTTGSDCGGWIAYKAGAGADVGTMTWSGLASLNAAKSGREWVLAAAGAAAATSLVVPSRIARSSLLRR